MLAILVAMLAGCQQPGYPPSPPWNLFTKSNRPKRPVPPKDPTPKLDDQQKGDVQMALARSMERQKQPERAIRIYQAILKKDDTRADAYHRLAVLHDKSGDGKKAAEYYQEALRRDPANAQLHCDLGYSFYLRKKWPDAEKHLRRALTLDPHLAKAHNNLALLLARTDRSDAALREFELGGSTESAARANVAFVAMTDQRFDKAEEEFELALAADPQSASARNGLKTLHKVATAPLPNDALASDGTDDAKPNTADGTVQVGFVTAGDRTR
ncbi:MAG TPA: tetratricopeptide repeat protein [Thermoguttaceae bacterium]|nr:tetratricopeptide repeat protein [Thermoguttaceae bacterium]